jgi:hypothetical protein
LRMPTAPLYPSSWNRAQRHRSYHRRAVLQCQALESLREQEEFTSETAGSAEKR